MMAALHAEERALICAARRIAKESRSPTMLQIKRQQHAICHNHTKVCIWPSNYESSSAADLVHIWVRFPNFSLAEHQTAEWGKVKEVAFY
jgi:hypothetical protein